MLFIRKCFGICPVLVFLLFLQPEGLDARVKVIRLKNGQSFSYMDRRNISSQLFRAKLAMKFSYKVGRNVYPLKPLRKIIIHKQGKYIKAGVLARSIRVRMDKYPRYFQLRANTMVYFTYSRGKTSLSRATLSRYKIFRINRSRVFLAKGSVVRFHNNRLLSGVIRKNAYIKTRRGTFYVAGGGRSRASFNLFTTGRGYRFRMVRLARVHKKKTGGQWMRIMGNVYFYRNSRIRMCKSGRNQRLKVNGKYRMVRKYRMMYFRSNGTLYRVR